MKSKKVTTLCLIYEHPRILLGLKKRGFGMGLWNGFGGKVNAGETIEAAAKREIMEESGIEVLSLAEQGLLEFEFQDGEAGIEMHVFRVDKYRGRPLETEEMKPQWFNIDEIPFKEMWSDDPYWMPLFFRGDMFKGRFLFDRASDPDHTAVIIKKEVKKVEEI